MSFEANLKSLVKEAFWNSNVPQIEPYYSLKDLENIAWMSPESFWVDPESIPEFYENHDFS